MINTKTKYYKNKTGIINVNINIHIEKLKNWKIIFILIIP